MAECRLLHWLISQEAATWLGSISTSLAVVVALFHDEIRSWWHRPQLELTVRLAPPDCHKTSLSLIDTRTGTETGTTSCYYLRLWIKNTGDRMAEKAQVFAARLLKKQADGAFREVPSFLPMNLRWSHYQFSPTHVAVFADIAPNMAKHCDLGHIIHPNSGAGAAEVLYGQPKTTLELDLEVQPNTNSHRLEPGTYHLELKIAANNAGPVTKTIGINLTGTWSDDEAKMFSEGLGLTVLE